MTGPVRRLGPRSLTARLVLGVCGLVVVLVGLIGTATYFALKSFLADQLDRQLQNTVNSAGVLFSDEAAGPAPEKVWAVALDPDTGGVIDYPPGDSIVPLHLSAGQRTMLLTGAAPNPLTVTTSDGTQLRLTTIDGRIGTPFNSIPATFILGLSTADEHRTLSRVIAIELIIGLAAVAIAMAATTVGVRFTLRGLRRVTTTAQEVAAELSPEGAGLDRRVPIADETTEVGQLSESMNTLLGAVETQFAARLESEHRMRQFLADASHELRTPLTSIRGYAELARMQRTAGNADDNLDRIEAEGTRMSRLVEDLLVLARGDSAARPAQRELVDVDDVLADAVESARAAFPQRAIDLDLGAIPPVSGDREQLLRVARNLVTNAAVHTNADRPIRVVGRPDGTGVTVQVVDGGPGLPPDEAAHVFERFWRADKARTRARGGSGLGLSIVDSIVRAHGGSVHFESTVERGSTVTVWLPAAVPATPARSG